MALVDEPTFGDLLRRYRVGAGLTQEALAERASLSVRAVSALEAGARRAPYRETVRLLANALGLGTAEREALAAAAIRPRALVRSAAPETDRPPALFAPVGLPAPLTSFVGRADEVAALARIVRDPAARLVTLTGVGGCGKTRLAVEVARAVQAAFPDGVRVVELAPVVDAALLPQAVAWALGVVEAPGVPLLDTLQAALTARQLLIVLDNCEHLVDACAGLTARLLAACPALCLLATSREPLRVAGERQWWVPPLPVPASDAPAVPEALAGVPAVQLFVERAQAVAPGFGLTEANAAAVIAVCRRVDGIPLAIELAAARVRVLAVEQIAERLDDALQLLTGHGRATPTRQQTLRATLDWSYDLLSQPEQALFRRLAVFAGGCDLEAAEAVCAAEDLPPTEVLDLLTWLVDKSLVLVEAGDGAAWYRLLEPVRQYAMQHLEACEEADAVRVRHASWYVALAERAAPELRGPAQVAWLAHLERERDNLRAALRGAEAHGEVETEARLAVALVPFWESHSHLSEGRSWLEAVLALPRTALSPSLRARVLVGVGRLAQWQADLDGAAACLEESLTAARAAGDPRATAESLAWLGAVFMRRGDAVRTAALLEESLPLYQELGDTAGIALVLLTLGVTMSHRGDLGRARALLEGSLPLYRQLGDLRYVAITCTMLAAVVQRQGDPRRALALLREGLAGHLAVGDRMFLVVNLRQWAGLAAGPQPAHAARLLGAAAALGDAVSAPPAPVDRAADEKIVATIRARLPEAERAAAWAAGRTLTPEQAATEAASPEGPCSYPSRG